MARFEDLIETASLRSKYLELKHFIGKLNRVLVAFSGGADSGFLLFAAKETLAPDNVLAVVADSATFSEKERDDALLFLKDFGMPYKVTYIDELNNPNFVKNDTNRCYFCREGLFSALIRMGNEQNFKNIVEGSNMDDEDDYRPGRQAIKELKIYSPLKEANLYKWEIRQLSKLAGLSTWDRPSMACISSRIPYGQQITMQKIKRIETLESYIRSHGIRQVRVRDHGNTARIEILPTDFAYLMTESFSTQIFKELGFNYVTLDLDGYRSGSMNESSVLNANTPKN
jgi:pyridinium-3,5-biscarboxylic acid mononucleotide sulfurtransferase